MKIIDFFNKFDLDNSLLIGFYGGGNFGDELLLETLIILFTQFQFKNIKIIHFPNRSFTKWHKIPNNLLTISYKDKFKIFKHILKSRNLIVGGGGIWGEDSGANTLIMSFVLLFCKFVLSKKVYLLGVGYYNSKNFWGTISAWFSGCSANLIITRDTESFNNFKKINKNTFIDLDLTFNLINLNLENYKNDARLLAEKINLLDKNIFFSIREGNNFGENMLQIIKNNQMINFILLASYNENSKKSKYINNKIRKIFYGLPNLSICEFDYNPVAFFYYLREYSDKILMISPRLHMQIAAYLASASFMPLSYAAKTKELLRDLGIKNFHNVQSITIADIQNEIDNYINR